jgi:hypothetical protein
MLCNYTAKKKAGVGAGPLRLSSSRFNYVGDHSADGSHLTAGAAPKDKDWNVNLNTPHQRFTANLYAAVTMT